MPLNWKGVEVITVYGTDSDSACKPRLQPQWETRNGQLVSAEFQSKISALCNQIARYRCKEYSRSSGDVTAPIANKHWRFAGCFGPTGKSLVVRMLMAPSNQSSVTSNPYVRLNVYDTSDTLIATARAHFGASYGIPLNEAPSEWGAVSLAVNISAYREQCFRAEIIANEEARPISYVAYETAMPITTENAYVASTYSVGQPILDTDRRHLQDLAHSLYKYGGPGLFTFSSVTDAQAPSNSQAVFANVINPLFGLTPELSAGYLLDLRYSNRKTTTTVPARVECYAACAGAGTGTVRVVDLDGNVYASFTVTGAAAWQTADTADLPADDRKYYVEYAGDGANAVTVYCVSAYRYQS